MTHDPSRRAAQPAQPANNNSNVSQINTFPFVGIGASAGGLEAFSELLHYLPPDTGMTFVFIQHLHPSYESALCELLQRETTMPVHEVIDDMVLEPNHIYVIPPKADLEVFHGMFKLISRPPNHHQHLPIDHFLRSLAQDQGNKSIGVILSGTASDGVLGLKAIKGAGGITFAQEESSAKYDGMPHSAIAAGCVDFILKPQGIAQELKRIAKHPLLTSAYTQPPTPLVSVDKTLLDKIFLLLRQFSGIDFTYYKLTTIQRRIARRMVLHRVSDLKSYVKYLQQNKTEVAALYQDILINVTEFFREPESYQILQNKIFPHLMSVDRPHNTLRVWVPGCSTGEEAYSIGICLLEFTEKLPHAPIIQIFATDIDDAAIETARAGIYPESIATNVSETRLRRFFIPVDRGFQVSKQIRDMCVFARQNVFQDPPFSKIDLISCRNLLIYLGAVLQKKILLVFHYALRTNGILFLGSAESIGEYTDLFKLVDKKHKLYEKKSINVPVPTDFSLPMLSVTNLVREESTRGDKRIQGTSVNDLQNTVDRLLIQKYIPAAVVVDDQFQILQFRGKTGAYLEPAPGEPNLNLLKMAREGLMISLRSALHEAIANHAFVRRQDIQYQYDNVKKFIDLEVTPIQHMASTEYSYLVVFQEKTEPEETSVHAEEGLQPESESSQAKRIQLLEQELAATKEYLQSVIEQQETSNEELRSANEEIQSSNEELQSINEELVTAKEELQSANEELATVNDELERRNVELAQLNDDHANFINSVNIAFVIVNEDMTIRSFTPRTRELWNLLPGDVGRPITDISPKFQLPDLEQWVLKSIEEMSATMVEFQDAKQRWYSLRIRPYVTTDKKLSGAVMTFIDVNDIKTSLEETKDARDFAEAVVSSIRHPILVVDKDLRVVSASQAYLDAFTVELKDTIGNLIYHLGNGQWGIPQLRSLLEKAITQGESFDDFPVEHTFEHIGLKKVTVSGRYLAPGKTSAAMALMQIEFHD